jgi:DNA-binding CsgD family transcriptional regulator
MTMMGRIALINRERRAYQARSNGDAATKLAAKELGVSVQRVKVLARNAYRNAERRAALKTVLALQEPTEIADDD